MSDIIYEKGDVPVLYKSEAEEYVTLATSILSTTGAYNFDSVSSGANYSGASGGQQQLFNDLSVALVDYETTGTDWNAVRSLLYGDLVPVIASYKQNFTYDVNDDLEKYEIFQADGTTLVLKDDFTYDGNFDLSTSRRRVYDTNGTTVLMDYTDTFTYTVEFDLDEIIRVVTV